MRLSRTLRLFARLLHPQTRARGAAVALEEHKVHAASKAVCPTALLPACSLSLGAHSLLAPHSWFNQLNPALKHEPFTPEEEALVRRHRGADCTGGCAASRATSWFRARKRRCCARPRTHSHDAAHRLSARTLRL